MVGKDFELQGTDIPVGITAGTFLTSWGQGRPGNQQKKLIQSTLATVPTYQVCRSENNTCMAHAFKDLETLRFPTIT